jgi:hypothetical protein
MQENGGYFIEKVILMCRADDEASQVNVGEFLETVMVLIQDSWMHGVQASKPQFRRQPRAIVRRFHESVKFMSIIR